MKYYVVDAFAEQVFTGGPTGICVVEGDWPEDRLMTAIAAENNLPETAFVREQTDGGGKRFYGLRFFAPNMEIPLCGHATLATAYVMARFYGADELPLRFETGAGSMYVERRGDLYEMDLPTRVPEPCPLTGELIDALGGVEPVETYRSRDYFFLLRSEDELRDLQPDFAKMAVLDYGEGVVVTAKGTTSDFVTRAFFPKLLTDEDPVCGSAHCNLIPFWAKRLGKEELVSHQLSPRGAVLYCRLAGDRVKIAGKVAFYGKGDILTE